MAGQGLILWRVTYADPCEVEGDKVLAATARGVQLVNGAWRPMRSPTESWHFSEAEAKKDRIDFLQARWDRLHSAERDAYEALLSAMGDQ